MTNDPNGATGKAVPISAPHDPMREAVEAYRISIIRQEGELSRDDISEDEKEGFYEREVAPFRNLIEDQAPIPTTLAGAIAAIRFVADDSDWVQKSHARVLNAALSYFKQRSLR